MVVVIVIQKPNRKASIGAKGKAIPKPLFRVSASMKSSVSATTPTPNMVLASSCLRLSSTFLRYRLNPTLLTLSDLRFLSASPSSSRASARMKLLRPIKSKPRDDDDDEGQNGNGSVLVQDSDQRIVRVELHREATDAYMSYAMSVLLGRILPDIRDGLKPVHCRILYAMHELRLSSCKPFVKCARVVGEVLGKFHPHGDTAVYDSLVRMAHDFSLRSPLIQGYGNFGSIDADPAAAMHYTECRLENV